MEGQLKTAGIFLAKNTRGTGGAVGISPLASLREQVWRARRVKNLGGGRGGRVREREREREREKEMKRDETSRYWVIPHLIFEEGGEGEIESSQGQWGSFKKQDGSSIREG
jgi:hypothetical protein